MRINFGHWMNRPALTQNSRMSRTHWLLAMAWLALLAFAFQGSRGLWDTDEGRYVAVAQQMLQSGDFLVPHLDPERPLYTKPPMTYWAIAGSLALLGHSEWAARAPNALAFIGTGLLVLWIALQIGVRRPWLALVVWSTSLLPFVAANVITTDTLLVLFETAAVAAWLRWQRAQHSVAVAPGARRGPWWMWVCFSLVFMTKGPPGLLPLLVLVAYTVWEQGARGLRQLFAPAPVLLFLLLSFAWFAVLIARDPPLLRYFLQYEVVDRIASNVHHRNPGWAGLFRVYGPVALAALMPWILLLPFGALRRGQPNPAALPPNSSVVRQSRFLWLWLLVPFAVFAASQSRLALYLLPLAVPAALLLAARLERRPGFQPRTWSAIAVVVAVALLGLKAYGGQAAARQDSRALAGELQARFPPARHRAVGFIEMTPRYGLNFYTGQRMLQVSIGAEDRSTDDGQAIVRSLCSVLRSYPDVLLLVMPEQLPQTRTAAAACAGSTLQDQGRAGRYEALTVAQKSAP
jgi:4-amino-4-deoxy-L-arabinose transferase